MSALLTVTSLTKRFGLRTVLDDVGFAVPGGQVVVITGPSGSGKTTLLRSINALERPDAGTIRIGDAEIDFSTRPSDSSLRRLRRSTAMVFQAFNLFPHRTALENVVEGAIHVHGRSKADAEEQGRMLLARMGLADHADAYPAHLSGGQKQRVAIARGLAMEPALMLFDEPTSALDHDRRDEVLTVMRELAAGGMTMLIVTHEIPFAREVADRVLLLRDGRIVADGPPEAVI